MTNLNNNASISTRNTFPLDDRVQESTASEERMGSSEPKSGEGNALNQEEKLLGKTLKKKRAANGRRTRSSQYEKRSPAVIVD